MSILSRLFGGKSGKGDTPADSNAETYKDFRLTPQPIREGQVWRIAALIEKDGKSHKLIRADTMNDRDQAVAASIGKARQMIDEQGDALFG